MNETKLRLLIVKSNLVNVYVLINQRDEVEQLSFYPIEGDYRLIKKHQYQNLIQRYFAGDWQALDQIKICLKGSEFNKRILRKMRQIKFGEKLSYGELAKQAGFAKAARAVGSVCRRNPIPLIIPCHRVICSDGKLGQYAYGQPLKHRLLKHEQTFKKLS